MKAREMRPVEEEEIQEALVTEECLVSSERRGSAVFAPRANPSKTDRPVAMK
jgi:hypothetical protein